METSDWIGIGGLVLATALLVWSGLPKEAKEWPWLLGRLAGWEVKLDLSGRIGAIVGSGLLGGAFTFLAVNTPPFLSRLWASLIAAVYFVLMLLLILLLNWKKPSAQQLNNEIGGNLYAAAIAASSAIGFLALSF